jgi:hypothetical protein
MIAFADVVDLGGAYYVSGIASYNDHFRGGGAWWRIRQRGAAHV